VLDNVQIFKIYTNPYPHEQNKSYSRGTCKLKFQGWDKFYTGQMGDCGRKDLIRTLNTQIQQPTTGIHAAYFKQWS
jgi:hypothetical protein